MEGNTVSIFKLTLTATLMLGVAACGRSENTDNQIPDKAIAVNEQADASSPFAAAEQDMSRAMMAAVGTNAGDTWVRMMIAHHQGAIDMSRIVLAQSPSPSPEAEKMAQDTITKQSKEIIDLRTLVQNGTPDPRSAILYRSAMTAMDESMMAAKGSDVSATFLRKMLAHHQGAVAMSDVALANGVTGALKAQVEKTRSDQLQESRMVGAMLRGAPEQKPVTEASAANSSPDRSVSKGMPVPGTNTPEHVVHNMDNMAMNNN